MRWFSRKTFASGSGSPTLRRVPSRRTCSCTQNFHAVQRLPQDDDLHEGPQSLCGFDYNANGHRSLLAWHGQESQGQERQECCVVRQVRQVWSHGRLMLVRACVLKVWEEGTSRRQGLLQISNETHCSARQKASRANASVSIAARLASCQSENKSLAAIEDGTVPVQGNVGSLTALSCDDDDLPLLPVRPREEMDSAVSPILAE